MRKIAVSLSKGGVGKTTTAINLAHGLALAGQRVLLIDCDTQGQSAKALGVAPEKGLADLLTGNVTPEEALYEAREGLWILAGGRDLAGAKREIDRRSFGGELALSEAMEHWKPFPPLHTVTRRRFSPCSLSSSQAGYQNEERVVYTVLSKLSEAVKAEEERHLGIIYVGNSID